MDPSLYPRMAEVEDTHWWFAGRRALCDRLLDRLKLPSYATILEPGCGTGGNFAMLAKRGRVFAMDTEESAVDFAASRKIAEVARGALPNHIPFEGTNFDLIVMTDVLEHLDDPVGSLRALRARLKAGGSLLLTVPAMPWLWSGQDVLLHHRRRYRTRELHSSLEAAGFKVEYLGHCNFVLFPIIAIAKVALRLLSRRRDAKVKDDLTVPWAPLNRVVYRLYSSERHLLGRLTMPFGVSLIALARA